MPSSQKPPSAQPSIPAALVHYVARGLIERSVSIKILPTLIREISPAPLPAEAFVSEGLNAPLSQWQLSDHPEAPSLLSRLKKTLNVGSQVSNITWAQLISNEPHQPAAQLVFAPLTLEASVDVLSDFEHFPKWFADDGVLLFANLAAGGLPELVNAQPEWLELLTHWPNIMDAGARLQALRFGLPVLDVESVPLAYADCATMWQDINALLPQLRTMDAHARGIWHGKLQQLFDQGLRELSVQVLYGQVWQVRAPKQLSDTHTVSLESLTSQLEQRRTYK
ncbi:hypothetical protein DTO96_100338 [Ephemeroptericola cinctiostellae]|uniref:Uncharacterized protein n=1 Tax=Ephemeroptericola cinctiostellae TaxID=2268024 RepID=A0A345D8E0_9BURK|nr:hypothetical protein [Ephemeroptericola cinctiostellae]AXF84628.1 hypothetical protein DTO96_100338 [Ephemeroptericola cinctiostellae]